MTQHRCPFERILQLRQNLAIHSYLYYQINETMVSDYKWQAWAQELVVLQEQHPEYTDAYDEYFEDWNGSTGYHLCYIDGIDVKAMYVRRLTK